MKFKLEFSALGPEPSEQLRAQGIHLHDRAEASIDHRARAITLLHIHGLLTDSESDRARKRLTRQIAESVMNAGYQVREATS